MSFYSSAYVWFLQVHLELPVSYRKDEVTQKKEVVSGRESIGSLTTSSVTKGSCSDYAVLFTGKSNGIVVCIMEAKYNWTIHAAAQVCMLCPFESLTV